MTNIIIMKKLEILRELSKCDPETQSEQMLLENKWHQRTCSTQGCHKPSVIKKKKKKICKAQYNKVRLCKDR